MVKLRLSELDFVRLEIETGVGLIGAATLRRQVELAISRGDASKAAQYALALGKLEMSNCYEEAIDKLRPFLDGSQKFRAGGIAANLKREAMAASRRSTIQEVFKRALADSGVGNERAAIRQTALQLKISQKTVKRSLEATNELDRPRGLS